MPTPFLAEQARESQVKTIVDPSDTHPPGSNFVNCSGFDGLYNVL